MRFRIRYYAGPYSGTREVEAADSEIALATVRAWVHREMSLPMYSDSYSVEAVVG